MKNLNVNECGNEEKAISQFTIEAFVAVNG